MFKKLIDSIIAFQLKHPLVIILIFGIISVCLIPGIPLLINNVEPSLEKVLPAEIQEIETMNNMRSNFGADMIYILVYAENDARHSSVLKYADFIAQKIQTRDNILEVSTLADVVKQSNNGNIPDSNELIKELIRTNPQTPMYLSPDYSFTVIRVRSDTGASAELINGVITDIEFDIESLETKNPQTTYHITGFNAIDKATFDIIMSDFAKITLVSMLVIALVVFLTFGSLSKGMLPMVVVMNALIWTMGITGYLGLTITVVTMVSAAMIMGLGIDFGIHVVHNYFNARKTRNPKESFSETLHELVRAMLGASLTTSAGFLALLFGVLPAMKTLGIVLAIGIITTLIGSLFLLPIIVYLYDTKITKKSKK